MQCDIGVVGLGVMGANLALNMERNGFHIAATISRPPRARRSWPDGRGPPRGAGAVARGADGDAEAAAPRPDDGARRRRG